MICGLWILFPLFTGQYISFLEPSQLPWEYKACAQKYVTHQTKSFTRTISSLTGAHLLQGDEKNRVKCLSRGHKCLDWDSNPNLMTQQPEHDSNALNRLALTCYGLSWLWLKLQNISPINDFETFSTSTDLEHSDSVLEPKAKKTWFGNMVKRLTNNNYYFKNDQQVPLRTQNQCIVTVYIYLELNKCTLFIKKSGQVKGAIFSNFHWTAGETSSRNMIVKSCGLTKCYLHSVHFGLLSCTLHNKLNSRSTL